MRRPTADAAVAAREPMLWLVSVTLPSGSILRLSTRPATLTSRAPNGGTFGFEAGLEGLDSFKSGIDMLGTAGTTGTLTQATIRITTTEGLAELQANHHEIGSSKVEIALGYDGDAWEDREILLAGAVIQGVEFGYVGEQTALSVELGPVPTSALVGGDSRDMGTDWPDTLQDVAAADMSSVVGQKYVWVLGAPLSVPAVKVGNVSGANRLVLCGHHLGSLTAVTVYEDGVSQSSFTPANATLSTGDYAYVTHATEFSASSGAYTWSAATGGVAALDRPGAAMSAASVLYWLLYNSGLTIDWAATQSALDGLRSWSIGVYLDQEATRIDVVRDQLAQWLPIVEAPTAAGTAFVYADPYLVQPMGTLTMGQEILGRVGRMRTTDLDTIRNSFTLNYAYNAYTGEYGATATLGPDSSQVCAVSQGWYGVKPLEAQDCDIAHDQPTAFRILRHMEAKMALPRRIVSYALSPELYWLTVGSAWKITDPGYSLSGEVAYLVELERGPSLVATFELLDVAVTGRM